MANLILLAELQREKCILESTNAAPPSAPYSGQSVANYIWTVLIPLLQSNMTKFPDYHEYQLALLKLESLYQQALNCNDQGELSQILSEAEAIASGPNPSLAAPAPSLKLMDIHTEAESSVKSIEKKLTSIESTTDSIQNQISHLRQRFSTHAEGPFLQTSIEHLHKSLEAQLSDLSLGRGTYHQVLSHFDQLHALLGEVKQPTRPAGSALEPAQQLLQMIQKTELHLNSEVFPILERKLQIIQEAVNQIASVPLQEPKAESSLEMSSYRYIEGDSQRIQSTLPAVFAEWQKAGMDQIQLSIPQINDLDQWL